jgi:hypothetical protein
MCQYPMARCLLNANHALYLFNGTSTILHVDHHVLVEAYTNNSVVCSRYLSLKRVNRQIIMCLIRTIQPHVLLVDGSNACKNIEVGQVR